MSFLHFLDHWWNFPFLVMLALVVLFALLQLVGLLGGEHGGDVGGDHDADLGGGGHDVHVDAPAGDGLDHHVEVDHAGDAGGHDAGPGALAGVLGMLGVGRVPITIVFFTLFLATGLAGLIFNRLIFGIFGRSYPGYFFALALLVACVLGIVAVAVFAKTAGRLVDTTGTPAPAKRDLAGRLGVVASPLIDDKFGEVRLHDPDGNEMLVHGRLQAGEAPLKQGQKVVLVDFDADSDMFWVSATPDDEAA